MYNNLIKLDLIYFPKIAHSRLVVLRDHWTEGTQIKGSPMARFCAFLWTFNRFPSKGVKSKYITNRQFEKCIQKLDCRLYQIWHFQVKPFSLVVVVVAVVNTKFSHSCFDGHQILHCFIEFKMVNIYYQNILLTMSQNNTLSDRWPEISIYNITS